jgi:ribosomal protein L23
MAAKKTTLKEVGETLAFIVEHMATKDDIKELEKKLTDKIEGVDSKVAGINRRLDTEAMQRSDLKLPKRVHDLEEETFGPGRSKHPRHVPF